MGSSEGNLNNWGGVATGPATQGLQPQKSPKRVPKKSTPGQGPKSPEKVRRGVPKESEKSPKNQVSDSFSDSFGTPGRTLSALLGPSCGVLLRDSFWTLPAFWGGGATCKVGATIKFVSNSGKQKEHKD